MEIADLKQAVSLALELTEKDTQGRDPYAYFMSLMKATRPQRGPATTSGPAPWNLRAFVEQLFAGQAVTASQIASAWFEVDKPSNGAAQTAGRWMRELGYRPRKSAGVSLFDIGKH